MLITPNPNRIAIVTMNSGREIDLNYPNVDDFTIEDVAHSLSLICRWGGNTFRFFSVAEHSVMTAKRAPVEHKKSVLMHDSEEHIIGDNITPLKEFLPELRIIGDRIRDLLLRRFDVPIYDEDIVKKYDREQMLWEYRNIVKNDNYKGLSPEKAEKLFLEKFKEYSLEKYAANVYRLNTV